LINEPIANKSFETLDELEEVLFQRCRVLLGQRDLIRGLPARAKSSEAATSRHATAENFTPKEVQKIF
jgi:hypothetical protein